MAYLIYLFVVASLVTIDQFTKTLAVTYISLDSSITIIEDFFKLTCVRNYGAAFSILQNGRIFFLILTPICVGLFCYLLLTDKSNNKLSKIGLLLMIGGTIGNLIDRFFNVYVVDFLDFYIFGYNFPVFNFADMCLTIGVFLYILSYLLEKKHAKD